MQSEVFRLSKAFKADSSSNTICKQFYNTYIANRIYYLTEATACALALLQILPLFVVRNNASENKPDEP